MIRKRERDVAESGAAVVIAVVVLVNLAILGFVGWLLYMLVTWLVSK